MCNNNCTLTTHDKNCKGRNCAECWINYCIFDDEICPTQKEIHEEGIKEMWDDEFNLRELKIQLQWAGYSEKEIEAIMCKEVDNERRVLPEPCNRGSN